MTPVGLPHSDISGSKRACRSPKLFAACHVLHRLSVPRHPPSTLSNLTIKCLDLMRSAASVRSLSKAHVVHLYLQPVFNCQGASGVDALKTEQEDKGDKSLLRFLSTWETSFTTPCDVVSRPRYDPRRKKLLRKEVIQPQVLLQLPCYDFTPITDHTLGGCLPCGLAHRLLVQPTFVM
jgi:hypothetical protein